MVPIVLNSSCEPCRQSKVKCSGEPLCQRCAAKGYHCVYNPRKKRGKAREDCKAYRACVKREQLENYTSYENEIVEFCLQNCFPIKFINNLNRANVTTFKVAAEITEDELFEKFGPLTFDQLLTWRTRVKKEIFQNLCQNSMYLANANINLNDMLQQLQNSHIDGSSQPEIASTQTTTPEESTNSPKAKQHLALPAVSFKDEDESSYEDGECKSRAMDEKQCAQFLCNLNTNSPLPTSHQPSSTNTMNTNDLTFQLNQNLMNCNSGGVNDPQIRHFSDLINQFGGNVQLNGLQPFGMAPQFDTQHNTVGLFTNYLKSMGMDSQQASQAVNYGGFNGLASLLNVKNDVNNQQQVSGHQQYIDSRSECNSRPVPQATSVQNSCPWNLKGFLSSMCNQIGVNGNTQTKIEPGDTKMANIPNKGCDELSDGRSTPHDDVNTSSSKCMFSSLYNKVGTYCKKRKVGQGDETLQRLKMEASSECNGDRSVLKSRMEVVDWLVTLLDKLSRMTREAASGVDQQELRKCLDGIINKIENVDDLENNLRIRSSSSQAQSMKKEPHVARIEKETFELLTQELSKLKVALEQDL